VIRHNTIRSGGGVLSFGSETSGGIRNVVAYQNRGIGTNEGIRFKSARTRGGYVADVLIRGLKLENVPLPFTFNLNWNPSYSYATIPKDMQNVPRHWVVLSTPVMPPERGLCEFRNITIEDVQVTGAKQVFSATGLPEKPIRNVNWINITAQAETAGVVELARDWTMTNVRLQTRDGLAVRTANNVNVDTPVVEKQ
jgi:hypothetical protein